MKDKSKLLQKLIKQRERVENVATTAATPAAASGTSKPETISKPVKSQRDKDFVKKVKDTQTNKKGDTSGNTKHNKKNNASSSTSTTTPASTSSSSNVQLTALQQKMQEKLQGGQFRWLNEKLYTTTSDNAYKFMQEEPEMFEKYHEGFRVQVKDWPVNPVDVFIKYLRAHPKLVVGDFGCGDAKIAQSVKNKVHSFDLVSVNKYVTACDMSKVPLPKHTLDIAIFSLSLMGTNFLTFIKEAHRCLKINGEMHIAEVRSRFEEQNKGVEKFIQAVEDMGFKKTHMDRSNKMFIMLHFKKVRDEPAKIKHADGTLLKPCIYKRR